MNLFKSAYRIVETPVPMPYRHVLYFLTFCYVFVTPWVYAEPSKTADCTANDDGLACKNAAAAWANGWAASTLICIAYYGVMELAAALQNPFGWDAIDLDLEMFGVRVHNEVRRNRERERGRGGKLGWWWCGGMGRLGWWEEGGRAGNDGTNFGSPPRQGGASGEARPLSR